MRFIHLALPLFCAACMVPGAPPSAFLPPATLLEGPAVEVAALAGSDSIVAGSGRLAVPLGDFMAVDAGLYGGYSNAGTDFGLWVMPGRLGSSTDLGVRMGGSIGTGYSAVSALTAGRTAPITRLDQRTFSYAGVSGHLQVVEERPEGAVSVLMGGGFTAWLGYPDIRREPFANVYIDVGARFDRPSGVFYGFGMQVVPFAVFNGDVVIPPAYPSITLGRRF